jgi:transcriptional regulator with XRE-family HTH domain
LLADVRRELLAMDLRELRQEAGKTQAEVAGIAEMTQAELSKFERRDDHLISTLPSLRDGARRTA